jgi:predicted AAA+ superfamily ATPase
MLEGTLKPALPPAAEPDVPALAQRVVAGGFPEAVRRTPERARAWHRQYLRAILERDVRDVARVRDPLEISRLLELLALRAAQLLNVSTLTNELNLRRETVEHYFSVCERLFLVRRLPAWHTNRATRLIKSPKVHLVDSGLAATLSGFRSDDAVAHRERFGHLLENFVVQQLMAQSGWTAPELEFSHYRDKDQVEVDLVISRGRDVWGVEVKAAATVTPSDGAGLRRLADQCGKHFRGGALMHAGNATVKLAVDNCLAVPLARLWDM